MLEAWLSFKPRQCEQSLSDVALSMHAFELSLVVELPGDLKCLCCGDLATIFFSLTFGCLKIVIERTKMVGVLLLYERIDRLTWLQDFVGYYYMFPGIIMT